MSKTINDTGLGRIIAWISARVFKKSESVTTQTLGIDTVPANNSNNLITSGGVYSALGDKQDVIDSSNKLDYSLISNAPQANWTQNTTTANDYIKNKPIGDINGEAAIKYVNFIDEANDTTYALYGSDAHAEADHIIEIADHKTTNVALSNGISDTYYPSTQGLHKYANYVENQKNCYLTFEILSSGNVTWKATDSGSVKTISYRKNSGSWTNLASTTSGASVSVVSGDILEFKGSNTQYSAEQDKGSFFTGTCKFNLRGNIMSLIAGYDFKDLVAFTATGVFSYFFKGSNVVNAKDLVMPATTLTQACYYEMFKGCSYLVTAPELPATTVADYAYNGMFSECDSLLQAPELLASTVGLAAYEWMFSGCDNLKVGPSVLPISSFGEWALRGMFNGCASLEKAPVVIGTRSATMAESCCRTVFYNCSSLTKAPDLPCINVASSCYYGMFTNCTSLLEPPELPATTLASGCYNQMFHTCSSLRRAPELRAATLTELCYYAMFTNCASLQYIKCLATDVSASACIASWVTGVAATGVFVKNASMTTNIAPTGWAVYKDPELKDIYDTIGDIETLINAL